MKKSGAITSEIFVPQKMLTLVGDVFVISNSKKVSGCDNGINHAIFGVKQGGFLIVENSEINVTNVHGLVSESSPIIFPEDWSFETFPKFWKDSVVFFEDSNITIKEHGIYGLYFGGKSSKYEYEMGEMLSPLGMLWFKNTVFKVPDGTAIYINDARRFPIITVSSNTCIFADLLLDVKNNSYMGMQADAFFLVGGSRVSEESYAEIELFNKSQWTVTPGKNNNRKNSQSIDSSISFLRLADSSLVFKKPTSGNYQTLHVGRSNNDVLDNGILNYVYLAKVDSRLLTSAYLATDGENRGIKADKFFVYGDVYGKTKVYILEVSESSEKRENFSQDEQRDGYSVSVIQLHGKSEEDSFRLAAGCVALRGAPYRYRLSAYGSSSSLKKVKDDDRLIKQKLVNSNGGFWAFRLEAEYMQLSSRRLHSQLKSARFESNVSRCRLPRSVGSGDDLNYVVADFWAFVLHPEVPIKAVVPQVPTYLLLPDALFHVGFMDMGNQNKQLETVRTSVRGLFVSSENPAFFVRGYGENHRYASDLSALEYGYKKS
ncbi:hypothetical protein V4B17_05225 [Bartonella sp. B23]